MSISIRIFRHKYAEQDNLVVNWIEKRTDTVPVMHMGEMNRILIQTTMWKCRYRNWKRFEAQIYMNILLVKSTMDADKKAFILAPKTHNV